MSVAFSKVPEPRSAFRDLERRIALRAAGEDEVHEVMSFSGERHALIYTGLDMAMIRARSAYIKGRIEVEEFEAEVERILRKREQLSRGI